MSQESRKRQRPTEEVEEDSNDNDNMSSSGAGELSMDTMGDGGNELEEMQRKLEASESKVALLEATNKMLEGKLEIQELKGQIRVLKEENKAVQEELAKVEMEKYELNRTIVVNQQKMDVLKEQHEKAISWDQIEPDVLWNHISKVTKVRNPPWNAWNESSTKAKISSNGLEISCDTKELLNVFAKEGFAIGAENALPDHFLGTIIYYYEVTRTSATTKSGGGWIFVGLTDGTIPDGQTLKDSPPNSYAIPKSYGHCQLSGKKHEFGWPEGAIRPEMNGPGDVYGCGLVLSPTNKLAIFFTGNGILMGGQLILISHTTGDRLYPTVSITDFSVEANFRNDPAKPFKFDIDAYLQEFVLE